MTTLGIDMYKQLDLDWKNNIAHMKYRVIGQNIKYGSGICGQFQYVSEYTDWNVENSKSTKPYGLTTLYNQRDSSKCNVTPVWNRWFKSCVNQFK